MDPVDRRPGHVQPAPVMLHTHVRHFHNEIALNGECEYEHIVKIDQQPKQAHSHSLVINHVAKMHILPKGHCADIYTIICR